MNMERIAYLNETGSEGTVIKRSVGLNPGHGEPLVRERDAFANSLPPGMVAVDKVALGTVLQALVNDPHHIRELQATRTPVGLFGDNPINVLIGNYEAGPTIDLRHNAWLAIQQAASESKWIPEQYMMGDWVNDVCAFLRFDGPAKQATVSAAYWIVACIESVKVGQLQYENGQQYSVKSHSLAGVEVYADDVGSFSTFNNPAFNKHFNVVTTLVGGE